MKHFIALNSAANEYGETNAIGVDINGAWDLDTLDSPALAILESGGASDGALVDGAVPAPVSPYKFQVFVHKPDGILEKSPVIDGKSMTFTKQTSVAAVAKVMFVGALSATVGALNFVTGSAGTWGLRFIDKDKLVEDTSRQYFLSGEYTAADTEHTVSDAIVAAINADSYLKTKIVAVDGGGDGNPGYGFKVTGLVEGADFTLYAEDGIADADIYEYKSKNHANDGGSYAGTVLPVKAESIASSLSDEQLSELAASGVNLEGQAASYFGKPSDMLPSVGTTPMTTYMVNWQADVNDESINESKTGNNWFVLSVTAANANVIAAIDAIFAKYLTV